MLNVHLIQNCDLIQSNSFSPQQKLSLKDLYLWCCITIIVLKVFFSAFDQLVRV